jgi:tribbles-like protein
VLRDIKLRKFVFKDESRTELMLESLDDARLLSDSSNDLLADRQGCPAYVSPEILSESQSLYSGRAADVWSLGVILFTLLLGRYPFQDSDPVSLFRAIRHARYSLPRHAISPPAQCLLRWMLRCVPGERPQAWEILRHPWFSTTRGNSHWTNSGGAASVNIGASGGADSHKSFSLEPFTASWVTADHIVPQLNP